MEKSGLVFGKWFVSFLLLYFEKVVRRFLSRETMSVQVNFLHADLEGRERLCRDLRRHVGVGVIGNLRTIQEFWRKLILFCDSIPEMRSLLFVPRFNFTWTSRRSPLLLPEVQLSRALRNAARPGLGARAFCPREGFIFQLRDFICSFAPPPILLSAATSSWAHLASCFFDRSEVSWSYLRHSGDGLGLGTHSKWHIGLSAARYSDNTYSTR